MRRRWLCLAIAALVVPPSLGAAGRRTSPAIHAAPAVVRPATAAPVTVVVVNVLDFGADPTGATSSFKAFAAAIDACRRRGAAQLTIPPGRYTFTDPAVPANPAHVDLHDLSNLVVDGTGAQLVFHYVQTGIRVYRCQHVVLKGMSIDWDLRVASPGTVAVDPDGTKVIRVPPDWPITAAMPVRAVIEFNFQTWRFRRNPIDIGDLQDVRLIRPQTLASPAFAPLAAGMTVCVRHYTADAQAIQVFGPDDADVAIEDVTLLGCPGQGFAFLACGPTMRLSNCAVTRPAAGHRLVSLAADACGFGGCAGGITVEGCDFGFQGDDAINIHPNLFRIQQVGDRRTVVVAGKLFDHTYLAAGDRMRFCHRAALGPMIDLPVQQVVKDQAARVYRLTFGTDLPPGVAVGDFVGDLDRACAGFVLRNNHFHDNRARGMMIQASQGSITGNLVEAVTAAGLNLTSDCDRWTEGFGCHHVVVQGNTFDRCNDSTAERGPNGRHLACVNVDVDTPTGLGAARIHRHLTIADNVISHTPGPAIAVSAADDVVVQNNRVIDSNFQPAAGAGGAIDAPVHGCIMIDRAADVTIAGNSQADTRTTYDHGVYVDPRNTTNVSVGYNDMPPSRAARP